MTAPHTQTSEFSLDHDRAALPFVLDASVDHAHLPRHASLARALRSLARTTTGTRGSNVGPCITGGIIQGSTGSDP